MKNRTLFTILSTVIATAVGCHEEVGSETEGSDVAEQALLEGASNLPQVTATAEPSATCSITVDPARELVIRALSVVEDPVRTQWNGDASAPASGAWHFGRLMTHMAGTQDPSEFVLRWLNTWGTNRTVNGQTIPARSQIHDVIDAWPRLPDGRLDLTKAPFRLLAIVNRIDLRNSRRAGEGRFIFGLLDANGNTTQFTVILEYNLPVQVFSAAEWADEWHALSQFTLGSEAYRLALQDITDAFAGPNVMPTRVNGSAISQVRTNEIHLDFPWELREFRLNSSGRLVPVTTARTPDDAHDGTERLGRFINQNESQILAGTHAVPLTFESTPFRAASIFNNVDFWSAPNITNNNARHRFSLNTCNGCHGAETATPFLHVHPREQGQVAALSGFMTGITVADPVDGQSRTFNDIRRRRRDLRALLCATL